MHRAGGRGLPSGCQLPGSLARSLGVEVYFCCCGHNKPSDAAICSSHTQALCAHRTKFFVAGYFEYRTEMYEPLRGWVLAEVALLSQCRTQDCRPRNLSWRRCARGEVDEVGGERTGEENGGDGEEGQKKCRCEGTVTQGSVARRWTGACWCKGKGRRPASWAERSALR